MSVVDQSDMEVCTVDDLKFEISGKDASECINVLNEYFKIFAKPKFLEGENVNWISGSLDCINCGRRLNGVLGTFQWGITHGEGNCSECGWPGRAIHYIKDTDGEDFFNRPFDIILQYHPTCVSRNNDEQNGVADD